jgi:DNA polymerase III subunit gamma/tau
LGQRGSAGQLHRLWQLLLKGHDEVRTAPDPLVAAQMALLRVLHAAEMPDPGKLAEADRGACRRGSAVPAAGMALVAPAAPRRQPPRPAMDWARWSIRSMQAGQLRVAQMMRDWVRVIELAPERLVYQQADIFPMIPRPNARGAVQGDRQALAVSSAERARASHPCASAPSRPRAEARASAPTRWSRRAFAAFPGCRADRHPRQGAARSIAPLELRSPPMKSMEEMMGRAEGGRDHPEADERMQVKLDSIEVEGTAGGGLVKIRASAKGRILGVRSTTA